MIKREIVRHTPNLSLTVSEPRPLMIPLGLFPKGCAEEIGGEKKNESRWMQFLIRWVGHCRIDNMRISYVVDNDLSTDDPTPNSYNVTFLKVNDAEQDDFEYCTLNEPLWISDEHDDNRQ